MLVLTELGADVFIKKSKSDKLDPHWDSYSLVIWKKDPAGYSNKNGMYKYLLHHDTIDYIPNEIIKKLLNIYKKSYFLDSLKYFFRKNYMCEFRKNIPQRFFKINIDIICVNNTNKFTRLKQTFNI